MSITPAGKIRVMVAQTIADPMSEGYRDGVASQTPELPQQPELTEDVVENEAELQDAEIQDAGIKEPQSEEDSTLTDYIFRVLEKRFGYPGRRLEEFKKKFVRESVSPDGTKDLKIEIPDRYYPDPTTGYIKTVETEELGKMVQEINSKFGLTFNGAERVEGKWEINLTSAKREENPEDGIVVDNLDEVYGTPSSKKPDQRTEQETKPLVRASTSELIKASKDDKLIRQLRKIIGENNAS